MSIEPRPRVVIIAGPTASGKSAAALAIAEAFGGTIINADAMQVYRELAILTARPDAAMLARAPHLLYGVMAAAEACSAGTWRGLALGAIAATQAAGRLPIVVGGTGLYLRALTHGLARIPPVPAAIRNAVRARIAAEGAVRLHDELLRRDPAAAARIAPGDGQRIARALEVHEATGRGLTDWHRGAAQADDALEADFLTLLLAPNRATLYAACDGRLATMMRDGAIEEVRALTVLGLAPGLPAMKAMGVRPLLRHLAGEIPLADATAEIARETRRLAKRQFTWFRHQLTPDQVITEQFSESLNPRIFAFISSFLLTP